jgi:tripartite-type tricarboxylate transporter receptor subunit TctC
MAQGPDSHFPSRPIRIVVPYAAGGSTDQLARAIQQPMQEFLKQPVIVDNKVGAGGAIGTDAVAKSAPDGYTLVFGNAGPMSIQPVLRKLAYDPIKDFRPISTVAITPLILAVPASSKDMTLADFLRSARKSGTDWNFGSVGNGSLSHLTGEYFNKFAGTKLMHVPYNGGAPMMTAFGGGQLQAAFVTGLDGIAMLQAGKVRYLAVASPSRTDVVSGLPAIAEQVPGFQSVGWFGVLAPRGVPDGVARKLHEAVAYAVARPEVREMFVARQVEARSSSPEELDTMIRQEMSRWAALGKELNLSLD